MPNQLVTMPKQTRDKKRAASSSPYGKPSAPTAAAKVTNNIFKMNTNIGQHLLKNPGIAEKIVEKANLKQSDVRRTRRSPICYVLYLQSCAEVAEKLPLFRLYSKSAQEQET